MQMHVAEASAEIDCARLLMQRDTREAMALMREGQALELAMRVRNRRDQTYIVQLCRRAIDRLFAAAGSRGMFNDSAAQRRFRDMCAVSTHIALSWDMAGTTYGRVAFGLDPGPAMI